MVNAEAQVVQPSRHWHIEDPDGSIVPSAAILNVERTQYARFGKRAVDIAFALVGLIVSIPLFVVLAGLVRLNLGPGGIIYRQQRVGLDGLPFTIYKFRSMLPDRRQPSTTSYIGIDRRQQHKSNNDPRHTGFGRLLRASSLDELPQLVNVLKGDMSIVGPRPELVEVARRDGFVAHPRHMTRPGITGVFQVSELRAKNQISAGLHLDIAYVADIRLRSDLWILAKTVVVLAKLKS